MRHLLTRRNIRTMGELARMAPGMVQRLLGKQGIMPWQLANGICHLSVQPYQDPEAFSCEVSFSRDCHSIPRLLSLLNTMNDKLCHRSEEHTSELQSLMRISYAVFCLKKKNSINNNRIPNACTYIT